jgi:hypothetical protein
MHYLFYVILYILCKVVCWFEREICANSELGDVVCWFEGEICANSALGNEVRDVQWLNS